MAWRAVGDTIPLVSGTTGRIVEPGAGVDADWWRRSVDKPLASGPCLGTLAELEIETIIEVGSPAPMDTADGHRISVVRAGRPRRDRADSSDEAGGSFVAAVAAGYEAGLSISFAGLFAGETRRRIALPGYPFQRRRHWIRAR